MNKILFVGYRKGAKKASKKLGLDCLFLSDQNSAVKCKNFDLLLPKPDLFSNFINEQLNPLNFTHVIPLTEKSVPICGYIREKLNLKGFNLLKSNRCHLKDIQKEFAKNKGIEVTPFERVNKNTKIEELVKEWGLPIVVKEVNLSGSRGMFICPSLIDLKNVVKEGHLIEKFIHGTEMSIESLILNKKIIFSNITEYVENLKTNLLPAKIESDLFNKILEFNKKVIHSFEVENGVTHIEFYITEEGIVLGELAIRPPGGYIFNLISDAYDFDPWLAYIQCSIGQEPLIKKWNEHFFGVKILHPGKGKIKSINGLSWLKSIRTFHSIKLKSKIGDLVDKRIGSGNDIGYIILYSKHYEVLKKDLTLIDQSFDIQLQ